jgi:DNA-binding NtrC family response regulator
MGSISEMSEYMGEKDCRALIVNLDSTPVNNTILRDLKKKKPMMNIIALSERQFHPELAEALRDHINVCLKKPVDQDELIFWMKSIFENSNSDNQSVRHIEHNGRSE